MSSAAYILGRHVALDRVGIKTAGLYTTALGGAALGAAAGGLSGQNVDSALQGAAVGGLGGTLGHFAGHSSGIAKNLGKMQGLSDDATRLLASGKIPKPSAPLPENVIRGPWGQAASEATNASVSPETLQTLRDIQQSMKTHKLVGSGAGLAAGTGIAVQQGLSNRDHDTKTAGYIGHTLGGAALGGAAGGLLGGDTNSALVGAGLGAAGGALGTSAGRVRGGLKNMHKFQDSAQIGLKHLVENPQISTNAAAKAALKANPEYMASLNAFVDSAKKDARPLSYAGAGLGVAGAAGYGATRPSQPEQ